MFFLDRAKADSLHYVWDTALVRELVARRKIADVADELNRAISERQRKEWAAGTPEQWANESHRVAAEKVYADVPADGPPPKLGREYAASGSAVVAEQLQRGGIRLAAVLNQVLK